MGSNSPRVSIPFLGDGTNQQLWPYAWYFHETVGKCEVHCWIHVKQRTPVKKYQKKCHKTRDFSLPLSDAAVEHMCS
jgi:hypothetical protein